MPTLKQAFNGRLPPAEARNPLAEFSGHVQAEFVWHRPWPEEWERKLRQVSPKSDVHGWLHGTWEPGEEWVPGQRFVLYEMLHPRWIPFDLMQEYEGPSPRIEGHYCSDKVPGQFQCHCRRKLERWRGGPCSHCFQTESACTCGQYLPYDITMTQWRLFRETGYVPRHLFWIIQGNGGGHKAFFTNEEQDMLTVERLPLEPPPLGALPYAPFDDRVVAHIKRLNALKRYGDSLKAYRRAMGPEYALEIERRERDFRASVVQWFDQQMREECDLFVDAANNGELADAPKSNIDFDLLGEEGVAHYVETGQFLFEGDHTV